MIENKMNADTQNYNHGILSSTISLIIGMPIKRILKLMVADETARSHLEWASESFRSSNGDKRGIEAEEKGLGHVIKSLASIIPNDTLEAKFWNAFTNLVGIDTSKFISNIRAIKDNDITSVVKILKGEKNVWIAPGRMLGNLIDQLLAGDIENVTNIIANGLTYSLPILARSQLQTSAIENFNKISHPTLNTP